MNLEAPTSSEVADAIVDILKKSRNITGIEYYSKMLNTLGRSYFPKRRTGDLVRIMRDLSDQRFEVTVRGRLKEPYTYRLFREGKPWPVPIDGPTALMALVRLCVLRRSGIVRASTKELAIGTKYRPHTLNISCVQLLIAGHVSTVAPKTFVLQLDEHAEIYYSGVGEGRLTTLAKEAARYEVIIASIPTDMKREDLIRKKEEILAWIKSAHELIEEVDIQISAIAARKKGV